MNNIAKIGIGTFLVLCLGAHASIEVKTAEYKECKISIVQPKNWNGKRVLIAHGHRSKKRPVDVKVGTSSVFVKSKILRGWQIAASSFRRNGFIVRDAVKDMDNLRSYADSIYGKAKVEVVIGYSMGGIIATVMAERKKNKVNGALSVCSAHSNKNDRKEYKFNFAPAAPLLFYSNLDEYGGPRGYRKKWSGQGLKPKLWISNRPGHCNVSNSELTVAFDQLNYWMGGIEIPEEANFEIQMRNPNSKAFVKNDTLYSELIKVRRNLDVDIGKHHLDALNLKLGDSIMVSYNDKTVFAKIGVTYRNVKKGEYVAFLNADGNTTIAINKGDAKKGLNAVEGKMLKIWRP